VFRKDGTCDVKSTVQSTPAAVVGEDAGMIRLSDIY
jgi:hypothetical protein